MKKSNFSDMEGFIFPPFFGRANDIFTGNKPLLRFIDIWPVGGLTWIHLIA